MWPNRFCCVRFFLKIRSVCFASLTPSKGGPADPERDAAPAARERGGIYIYIYYPLGYSYVSLPVVLDDGRLALSPVFVALEGGHNDNIVFARIII